MKEKKPNATQRVYLPRMGESIHEAKVLRWCKSVGDVLTAGDALLVVATDKVDAELPAPTDGILQRCLAQPGEVVAVGQPVAVVATGEPATCSFESAQNTIPTPSTPSPPPQPPALSPKFPRTERWYSPLVRTLARQHQLDFKTLAKIPGTGPQGRLTKQDLLHHITHQPGNAIPKTLALPIVPGDKVIPFDRIRKRIAQRMTLAQQAVPQATSFSEVDLTPLEIWRQQHKKSFEAKHKIKLTYTSLFVLALIQTLRQFPKLNAWLDGDRLIQKQAIHLGLAVALPNDNLVVPVIHHAEREKFPKLVRKINQLVNQARTNQLQPNQLQGATYTLTNLGAAHSLTGTPILLPPQVGIVAVGALAKKPGVVTDIQGNPEIGIRDQLVLAHTYDHRVIDGMLGGQFLHALGQYLVQLPEHLGY